MSKQQGQEGLQALQHVWSKQAHLWCTYLADLECWIINIQSYWYFTDLMVEIGWRLRSFQNAEVRGQFVEVCSDTWGPGIKLSFGSKHLYPLGHLAGLELVVFKRIVDP